MAKIGRLADYVTANLSDEERTDFCAALTRDLRDGPKAQFTPAELAAGVLVNALLKHHPELLGE